LILGIWNLNFKPNGKGRNEEGFSRNDTIYIKVLKGRQIRAGDAAEFGFDGNVGRIEDAKFSGIRGL